MKCKHKERCVNNGRSYKCRVCKHNPDSELEDLFNDRGYIPTCDNGFYDCIHDPARRLYEYDKGDSWVRSRYTREELVNDVNNGCGYCSEEDCYDDEDK